MFKSEMGRGVGGRAVALLSPALISALSNLVRLRPARRASEGKRFLSWIPGLPRTSTFEHGNLLNLAALGLRLIGPAVIAFALLVGALHPRIRF